MRHTAKSLLVVLALAVGLAAPASAGPFEDATRQAAEQGDAEAQHILGIMYARGEGVTQDYGESAKWFNLAAEQGYADAEYGIGIMYAKGRSVPQDYVMAYMWFSLAAAQGDEDASKNSDIIAKRMTPDQIADAQRLAREWKSK